MKRKRLEAEIARLERILDNIQKMVLPNETVEGIISLSKLAAPYLTKLNRLKTKLCLGDYL